MLKADHPFRSSQGIGLATCQAGPMSLPLQALLGHSQAMIGLPCPGLAPGFFWSILGHWKYIFNLQIIKQVN